MKENIVFSSGDLTEEQAKAEVQRLTFEIQQTLDQIRRDREAVQHLGAQNDATLGRINKELKRMLAR